MIEILKTLYLNNCKVSIELSNGNKRLGFIEAFDDNILEILEYKESIKSTKSTFIPIDQIVAVTDLENKNTKIEDPEDVGKPTKSELNPPSYYLTSSNKAIDLSEYPTIDDIKEDPKVDQIDDDQGDTIMVHPRDPRDPEIVVGE